MKQKCDYCNIVTVHNPRPKQQPPRCTRCGKPYRGVEQEKKDAAKAGRLPNQPPAAILAA